MQFPAPEGERPAEYDAFLSYAHRDRQVTTAIQKGLHQIGRRLGRLRALRVFRDDTNLAASPDLWGKITEALDRSRFMIVVLSPQSAGSHWVNEEIGYWLAHRGHEQLMLVLAEGHLQWDAAQQRFDPEHSDAAPPALMQAGSLPAEPLYIDVSDDAPWDLGSLAFRDKVTALAAPIHGKPKDALAGEDLREQRQFRRLRAGAVAGLAVLTVVATVAALVAVAKQREANRNLRDAVVAKLNAEGASMLAGTTPGSDERALQELLAANAIHSNGVPILSAQIARFTTQKIVDTSSMPFGIAYSPDGRRVVTGHRDTTVRQWDSTTGKPVGSPMTGHTDKVNVVAYTADGHTIASAGVDGTMRLFNADSGAAINANPAQVGELTALAVSPDGQLIYTGGENDSLQLWDAHSGELRQTIKVYGNRASWIEDLALDRDGQKLAVAGRGGEIAIYDTKSLQPLGPNLELRGADGAPTYASRIAFSPDGHTLAVAGDDLQMWDVDAAKLVRRARLGTSDTAQATAVAFSRDGHRVATGSNRGAVQLWDADTAAPFGPTMNGHKGFVQGMVFSPDGRHLATSSLDGTLRLWSATIGQPMRGPDPFLTQTAFSPDGQRVAAAGDTAIQQWDLTTGIALPPQLPGGEGTKWFSYVAANRMVTAAQDGTTQVVDDRTGRPIAPPVSLSIADGYNNFAASGDGRVIAAGQRSSGTVQLWDVATGKAVRQPITIDTRNDPVKQDALLALTLSPDGHRLGGAYKGGPRLWNLDASQAGDALMVDPANPVNPIMSVAFSRDGDTLVAGSFESVELWDSANRRQFPGSPLRGHDGLVASVAFGVGHQLASGGVDATLRLWDTATGKPTAAPVVEPDSVVSVALSPDGRLAASANADGSLLLSPALVDTAQLCDKLSSNMSHKQWREWVSPGIDYIALCPGLPVAAD